MSNNQGDKKETFFQTGRRGGDGQPGREGQPGGKDSRQSCSWWTQQGGRLWSGVGKVAAGLKAAASGPGDRPHNPGHQCREIKPQTADWKNMWGLRRQWERLPTSQESLLEKPTGS